MKYLACAVILPLAFVCGLAILGAILWTAVFNDLELEGLEGQVDDE